MPSLSNDSDDLFTSDEDGVNSEKEDSKLLEDSLERKGMEGKTPYPKSVFFIVGNEFCERFCYYGMRAILVLYLTDWLGFGDDSATGIYHAFTFMCYFTPVLGAILADGYIGKYRTILYLSIVYGIGSAVLSLTAFPPPFWLGPMVGLLLISLGTGGIKPCVSAFGGDQFASDQKKEQAQFFSVFYFAINLGSLLSMVVTPAIRGHVTCFGTSCFALAFAIPAMLMVLALALFLAGTPLYKRYPPTGNVIGQSVFCIARALKNKFREGSPKKSHWLEHADDKYELKFIEDLKQVLRILLMYLPLPMFWALFDQQGSRWLLQAKQMNGRIGNFVFIPDWMPAFNALFIIIFIPLTEYIIYPLFNKCHFLQRALQRMVAGMLLAALAFVVAALLQVQIDKTQDKAPPAGEADFRIINASPCSVSIESELFFNTLEVSHGSDLLHPDEGDYSSKISAVSPCAALAHPDAATPIQLPLPIKEGFGYHLVIAMQNGALAAKLFSYDLAHGVEEANSDSEEPGVALVNVIYTGESSDVRVTLENRNAEVIENQVMRHHFDINAPLSQTPFRRVFPDTYTILVRQNGNETSELANTVTVHTGGFYTVIIQPNVSNTQELQMVDYLDVEPESVHIMWQLPQYIIITFGEILFSISGLQFSYSQAPVAMKSMMQAAWLLTDAFGNLIVVIIATAQFIDSQTGEFILFAVLMTLAAIVFGIMACFYKYVNQEICEDDKNTLVSSVGYEEEDETPVDEHEYMPIKKSSPLYVDEQ